jgi:tetratricopeptide (TPR) repeat protein
MEKRLIILARLISLMAALLFATVSCYAQEAEGMLYRANQLYLDKKYDEAIAVYQQVLNKQPANSIARYNLANSLFRKGDFEAAEKNYESLTSTATNNQLSQRAWYNKGLSLTRQKKLEASIAAYKQAVLMDPSDSDARFNLQKALEEWKKQQPKNKPDKNKQSPKDKPKQKEPPPPNKQMLDQWLQALRQKEQEVQKKMRDSKNRSAKQPDKDW